MLDVFNIAKPQNCDIQIFYGFANAGPTSETRNWQTWNKPRGISNVYMLLIGGGGAGDNVGGQGGGSGSVTVWYGAAQNVPDSLAIYVRGTNAAAFDTIVGYRGTATTPVTLLAANSTASSGGASARSAGTFAASGFYQSVAGQDGGLTPITPSATTFLTGGAGSSGADVIANYGYRTNQTGANGAGYFQLQPIIVGVGSAGNKTGAVGCGSGNSETNLGGPGLVLIASW
jgi:hypothetical protein